MDRLTEQRIRILLAACSLLAASWLGVGCCFAPSTTVEPEGHGIVVITSELAQTLIGRIAGVLLPTSSEYLFATTPDRRTLIVAGPVDTKNPRDHPMPFVILRGDGGRLVSRLTSEHSLALRAHFDGNRLHRWTPLFDEALLVAAVRAVAPDALGSVVPLEFDAASQLVASSLGGELTIHDIAADSSGSPRMELRRRDELVCLLSQEDSDALGQAIWIGVFDTARGIRIVHGGEQGHSAAVFVSPEGQVTSVPEWPPVPCWLSNSSQITWHLEDVSPDGKYAVVRAVGFISSRWLVNPFMPTHLMLLYDVDDDAYVHLPIHGHAFAGGRPQGRSYLFVDAELWAEVDTLTGADMVRQ